MNPAIDKASLTPMMQQYLTIKEGHPEALVLFRLGDFYELFFDDAVTASKALNIVLTARDAGSQKAPMCGVPYHAVDKYVETLIDQGFHVAICEQTDEIDEATKIVKRVVTKLITPGTFVDYVDDDPRYLAAYHDGKFAYVNVASGDVFVDVVVAANLQSSLAKIQAKELLVTPGAKTPVVDVSATTVSPRIYYKNHPFQTVLDILVTYLEDTQHQSVKHLKEPVTLSRHDRLHMDASTMTQLELFESSLRREKRGSLRGVLDVVKTSMGRRYLLDKLARPYRDIDVLNRQFDAMERLIQSIHLIFDTRQLLERIYDMDRLVTKINFASVTPKELRQLESSLAVLPLLSQLHHNETGRLRELTSTLDQCHEVQDLLANALVEIPPVSSKEGGIFALGYDDQLDQLITIHDRVNEQLKALEAKEQEATGIKKLKIGYNKPFGYYLEVTKGQTGNIDPTRYQRKQTLVNAERYITPELKAIEEELFTAEGKRIALEATLFLSLVQKLQTHTKKLQEISASIAALDYLTSLSYVAEKHRWVRPMFGSHLLIQQGRHPVVEAYLSEPFVANDISLDDNTRMLLITGPNMSGKSTYIRQVALIVIMAQMGSFVPAESATLPLFDQIFTRIGASDDVMLGQSTFMVEMLEVNQALSQATRDSLLLFDEIGRGTATFDGVAIAQATLEYIHHEIKCMTLFSTHYHELTGLENTLGTLKNVHVSAKEVAGELVFYHQVKPGAVDKSYGIHVAKLAKLPASLIKRAASVLQELETQGVKEITLFEQPKVLSSLHEQLKAIDLDQLSPKEALALLYEWQQNDE
jgi:DNA mismatch repair protein MutS